MVRPFQGIPAHPPHALKGAGAEIADVVCVEAISENAERRFRGSPALNARYRVWWGDSAAPQGQAACGGRVPRSLTRSRITGET